MIERAPYPPLVHSGRLPVFAQEIEVKMSRRLSDAAERTWSNSSCSRQVTRKRRRSVVGNIDENLLTASFQRHWNSITGNAVVSSVFKCGTVVVGFALKNYEGKSSFVTINAGLTARFWSIHSTHLAALRQDQTKECLSIGRLVHS